MATNLTGRNHEKDSPPACKNVRGLVNIFKVHSHESFFLAQYAENVGSGTTDMIRICREAGLRPPVYQYEHGTFRTIIYRNTQRDFEKRAGNCVGNPPQNEGNRVGNRVGNHRKAILQVLLKNPEITQKELAAQIGIAQKSIERNISWLKQNGYLNREGNNRTGRWIVLSGNDTPDQKP